ncbi:hypothetical protein EPIB1_1804 [Tritonibacter mobilis]|nr:hypothetical protein EPIB1_1804 [Tritonibacter mobilis]
MFVHLRLPGSLASACRGLRGVAFPNATRSMSVLAELAGLVCLKQWLRP